MARHDDRGTILWTDKKRTFLGLPLSFTRYYLTPSADYKSGFSLHKRG